MKHTDFLFATPTFLRGVSRLLDLGATGVVYNYLGDNGVDEKAIASDWCIIGEDLKGAMDGNKIKSKRRRKPVTAK